MEEEPTEFRGYRVEREINRGGAAIIYLAKNTKTNQNIALKVLYEYLSRQPAYKRRLQREIKYISQIKHPNLIKVFSTGSNENNYFVEMEYFPCETLKTWREKRDKMSMNEFFHISQQIISGLKALHDNDILHRDLSYENILINEANEVKLTDFSMIKILPGNKRTTQTAEITDAGSTYGTLPFMSPEQCQGREIDKSSDIFSLGVNLYYLLTGNLPFKGKNNALTIRAICKEAPPSIITQNCKTTFELQSLVFSLLSKRKRCRVNKLSEITKILKNQAQVFSEQIA